MFKKLNPLVLFGLLAVLLVGVVLILRMDARKQQGSFVRELVNADRQKTTSIVIIPRGMVEDAITLERKDDRWLAGKYGKMYQANRDIIERIFEFLTPLVPEQLVSRTEESWNEYEVSDISGTRVKIYQGNRLTSEFVFGKIDFQQQIIQGQQRPRISTYVRLAGQNDVYSVEGFLGSAFPALMSQYRDQTVLHVRAEDVEKITVQGGTDYNYELTREGTDWLLNGIRADSALTAYFFDAISWISSTGFVEEEAEGWLTIPSHQLRVERKAANPIELKAYPADTTHQFFITNSQNPGAVFSSTSGDLFENIFFPKDFFLGIGADPDPS